jgi:hypothetical protein
VNGRISLVGKRKNDSGKWNILLNVLLRANWLPFYYPLTYSLLKVTPFCSMTDDPYLLVGKLHYYIHGADEGRRNPESNQPAKRVDG